VEISFDPAKRDKTLKERGLDFADAAQVFAGPMLTLVDDRFDYPEPRHQTYGLLDDRLIMLVWTETSNGRRIISMRKANEREQTRFRQRLG
jgi:uncharacterized DUF497 family protein